MRVEAPIVRWSKLTQTRITQLDQALQQGGRPCTAAGQVVHSRVLGRPDKWDEGLAQLEFRDESLRGSHRSGFVGGHDERCFQRFWQETGFRSSVLVLREERSSSFRLSKEAKGH